MRNYTLARARRRRHYRVLFGLHTQRMLSGIHELFVGSHTRQLSSEIIRSSSEAAPPKETHPTGGPRSQGTWMPDKGPASSRNNGPRTYSVKASGLPWLGNRPTTALLDLPLPNLELQTMKTQTQHRYPMISPTAYGFCNA